MTELATAKFHSRFLYALAAAAGLGLGLALIAFRVTLGSAAAGSTGCSLLALTDRARFALNSAEPVSSLCPLWVKYQVHCRWEA